MPKVKVARKSTSIDMTAMCDVAFLLLSFFILTTKPKANEAIMVQPPSSVASKRAPDKDLVLVSIDKDGKVFLSMDDEQKKEFIANTLINKRGLKIDAKAFKTAEFFGTPFNQIDQFLAIPKEKRKGDVLPGIPCKDSLNNEMIEWMRMVYDAYNGQKMNLLLKGDNASKYPAFKNVIDAFKKNDFLKFQMITNAEGVPVGTDLYKTAQLKGKGGAKAEE